MSQGYARGDDIIIRTTVDGEEQASLENVDSFDSTVDLRMIEEQFLGRKGIDVSEIHDGCSGTLTVTIGKPGVFDFIEAVFQRATRQTFGTVFNFMEQIAFPSGEVRILIYRDVAFGAFAMPVPGRDQHKKLTIPWKTGEPLQVVAL